MMTANDRTARRFTLREYRAEDVPLEAELSNMEYPDEPVTEEQVQYQEETYPAHNPRLRFVAEAADGKAVALGAALNPFWMKAPGVYWFWALVHPDHRRRGIASAILAQCEPFARERGATRLWSDCRESQAYSIAFLNARGFSQFGLRFESTIDLAAFDPGRFAGALQRVTSAGYSLTTLAEERTHNSDADRALFDLYRQTLGDTPLPGGARIDPVYEDWRNYMLDHPTADPTLIFIARRGEEWVGMTSVDPTAGGPAITSATGVQRAHRGHGLALALKVASLAELKRRGRHSEARTHNDTANPPILHLNERIGYRRLPGWMQFEKSLGE